MPTFFYFYNFSYIFILSLSRESDHPMERSPDANGQPSYEVVSSQIPSVVTPYHIPYRNIQSYNPSILSSPSSSTFNLHHPLYSFQHHIHPVPTALPQMLQMPSCNLHSFPPVWPDITRFPIQPTPIPATSEPTHTTRSITVSLPDNSIINLPLDLRKHKEK